MKVKRIEWVSYVIFLKLTVIFGSKVLRSNDQLANRIYTVLDTKEKNIIFSPISLHAALSMAYEGSAGNTTTVLESVLQLPTKKYVSTQYKEALNVLFKEDNVKNVTLRIASKIYIAKGFRLSEKFENVVKKDFLAEISSLDLSNSTKATIVIDKWLQNRTGNKIKRLSDPFLLTNEKEAPLLIVASAIYFKGNWMSENAFIPSKTKRMPFYQDSSRTVRCWMMSRKGKFLYWASERLDAVFLKLDYDDDRFSMVIALPQNRGAIDVLERKLADRDLSILINRFYPIVMNVHIPKFRLETALNMKSPLQQIGLSNIFGDNANFSEMIQDQRAKLKITEIKQKVVFEVDEGYSDTNDPNESNFISYVPPKTFIANHPFIVFLTAKLDIQEDCQHWDTVLLMGKVFSPEEAL